MNLPKSVNVVEVGPRDGFKIEGNFIPTATQIELMNALINRTR
jgi:hydroxymethylglutaryl-CoA lyase